jgi:hypothetical protein
MMPYSDNVIEIPNFKLSDSNFNLHFIISDSVALNCRLILYNEFDRILKEVIILSQNYP